LALGGHFFFKTLINRLEQLQFGLEQLDALLFSSSLVLVGLQFDLFLFQMNPKNRFRLTNKDMENEFQSKQNVTKVS